MRSKFFNPRLYWDTLKRLRLTGVVMAILSVLPSLLIVFIQYINYRTAAAAAATSIAPPVALPNPPSFEGSVPGLYFFMFAGALFLVYTAFSFLNKRNASDFFHALPDTRGCMYITTWAAMASWIFIAVCTSVLLTWSAYAVTGMPFIASYVPSLLLMFFIGSLLVASTATIAVSLTGTLFSSIALTGIILFLPRMLIFVFCESIMAQFAVIAPESFGGFLDPSLNIPVGSFLSAARFAINPSLAISFMYTFMLASLYMVLGYIAFKHRESESATKSAPSRLLQHVYRCLITLPVMLFCIFAHDYRVAGITVFLIVAAVVYFLYEIITTKKAKNLVRSIPGFLILIVFSLLFGVAAYTTGHTIASYVPQGSDIDSIVVKPSINSGRSPIPTYSDILVSTMPIKNEKVNELITESLEADNTDRDRNANTWDRQLVTLNLKDGKKITRNVLLSAHGWGTVYSDPGFMNVITQLPLDDEITDIFLSENINSSDKVLETWNLYKEEVSALDLHDFALITQLGYNTIAPSAKAYNQVGSIWVSGHVGSREFTQNYIISSLTPRTLKAYTDVVNTKFADAFEQELDQILAELEDGPSSRFVDIMPYTPTGGTAVQPAYMRLSTDYHKPEFIVTVVNYLKTLEPNSIDGTLDYIWVRWKSDLTCQLFLPITKEQLAELTRLSEEANK